MRPGALLREPIRQLDLRTSALIITASKDLSLPALRAAVVITRNRPLLQHLGSDRFERLATTSSPMAEAVMILYTTLLQILQTPASTSSIVQAAHGLTRAAGQPAPPGPEAFDRLRLHLTAMRRRFRHNLHTLERMRLPLRRPSGHAAPDGYSGFAELATPQADFFAWTRHCASRGLLLNPTVVHGGTAPAWKALHPG
ncbi:hypothetical protein [Streptomyces sp. NPDC020965]|uniref:hypothetical protein n=1 Tax=Streptomyces sp. NPDC020965 TaxID=3365105 RepID=UPI0037A3804B